MADKPSVPESVYTRYPFLRAVDQACDEFDRGDPITARCPKCGTLLHVRDVLNLSRWVLCETRSCLVIHFNKPSLPPTE